MIISELTIRFLWNFLTKIKNRLPKKEDGHCEVFAAVGGRFLGWILEEASPAGRVAVAVETAGRQANGDFKSWRRYTTAWIG